ncbi:hypothetical protein HPB48_006672 [Haemaphysalis longicornis]|uniref:Uncharacterized protein n=1 Tax=Haemaphysalis longicornis TaxID=44386 RepID=A0A9J6FBE2_HAELO|nr:hypothetical protein HPB48_006672 [Haemaphysalis longicornis]
MKATGMAFGKCTSNSDELTQHLEREDLAVCKGMVVLHDPTVKVLGTAWDPQREMFLFQISDPLAFPKGKTDTKRFILQATSEIFDPVGFVGLYTMSARVLFQKRWPRGIGWNEQPPQDQQNEWDQWVHQLRNLEEIALDSEAFPALVCGFVALLVLLLLYGAGVVKGRMVSSAVEAMGGATMRFILCVELG